MGLVMLLDRCEVTEIDESGADLLIGGGVTERYQRKPRPVGTVSLWSWWSNGLCKIALSFSTWLGRQRSRLMILSLLRAKYPLAAPDALNGRSACQVAAYYRPC